MTSTKSSGSPPPDRPKSPADYATENAIKHRKMAKKRQESLAKQQAATPAASPQDAFEVPFTTPKAQQVGRNHAQLTQQRGMSKVLLELSRELESIPTSRRDGHTYRSVSAPAGSPLAKVAAAAAKPPAQPPRRSQSDRPSPRKPSKPE